MQTCIIYATKHGATRQAALHLAEKLSGDIQLFDLKKDPVVHLEDSDNIIIGGSIYMGNIQKDVKQFIKKNASLLLTKKIGLFICAGQDDPKIVQEQIENAFPKSLLDHATCKTSFGFIYDFSKLNGMERMIIKKIIGIKQSKSQLANDKIVEFATNF